MKSYISWIESKVNHKRIFLNFAGGVILDNRGSILLQKRGDTNRWGLPGGAIELGESLEEAAIREVREETGLEIRITKLLGVYSDKKYYVTYPNGDKCQPIVVAFYAEVLGGKLKSIKSGETKGLHYFPKNRLPPITNKQHVDMINDAFNDKSGIWR